MTVNQVAHSAPRSASDLWASAERVLPGGSLGHYIVPGDTPTIMERGHGSRIVDTEGREFVDFVLGSGPLVLGHAHPAVVDAVVSQARSGSQFYWLSQPAIELAETIADAAACAEKVKFASTGAEATFYALRLARAYTGRDKVIRFRGSYHGGHDFGIAGDSAGIPRASRDATLFANFNDVEMVRDLLVKEGDDVAAVIVEPLQRMTLPQDGFLEALRELTTAHGVVLIFDEVVTGFRSAWGGAQETYGVVPDLATYGKIIGGGYPLSAVSGGQELMRLLDPRDRATKFTYMSGTLSGNPLCAAAGLATLRVLQQPGTYEWLTHLGAYLRDGLRRLAADVPQDIQVLGDGALAGLAFSAEDPLDPGSFERSDRARLKQLERELVARGLFVNLAANGKMYLSTAHTEADLDFALETLADSLAVVCRT